MSPARIAAKTSAGSSSSGGTRRGGVTGVQGAGSEVGPVELGELAQAGQVEHPADLVAVGLARGRGRAAAGARVVRRHRPLDLEPDGLAEASAAELLLDRQQQVVRLVLLDREVGVAGDPEEVVLLDLHAAEQRSRLASMTWSMSTNRDGSTSSRRGRICGTLTRAKPRSPLVRVAQPDRDRQAERRDVRERVARVDRERRQDREDLVEEPLAERLVVLRDRGVVDDLDALGRERPADVDVDRRVLGDELEDPRRGRPRAAPRRSGRRASGRRLPASTCWRRPATRTWKNSSRLPAKMARNLTRSSSGLRSSRASRRTRALNSSHDSSRLRYGQLAPRARAFGAGGRRSTGGRRAPGSTAAIRRAGSWCVRIGPHAAPAGEDSTLPVNRPEPG